MEVCRQKDEEEGEEAMTLNFTAVQRKKIKKNAPAMVAKAWLFHALDDIEKLVAENERLKAEVLSLRPWYDNGNPGPELPSDGM